MIKMNIMLLSNYSTATTRATEGSAGYDLYADIKNDIIIEVGDKEIISTGVAIDIGDRGYVCLIYPRSGMAINKGISLSNSVGVIDSDYRGEIKVCLKNDGKENFFIKHGDRIAQMVITPIEIPELNIVEDLDKTLRGKGGFGSTGL